MNVFIWGCYSQGNFGDDLMAVLFAKLFEAQGCNVKCYKLSPTVSSNHQIDTISNVDEGVAWSDIVILGGGAFLKREKDTHININNDVKNLRIALDQHNRDIYCLSIGSDNIKTTDELYAERQKILANPNFKGGTVRLKRDLAVLPSLNLVHVEDIVLILPVLFKHLAIYSHSSNYKLDKKHLLNISKKNFIKLIFSPSHWKKIITSTYFRSHDPKFGIKSEIAVPMLSYFNNEDPIVSAFELATSKSIISSKLHVGIAACSFGVGFKSVFGNDKTKAFIDENKEFLIIENGYYSMRNEKKQIDILNKYLKVISEIVNHVSH